MVHCEGAPSAPTLHSTFIFFGSWRDAALKALIHHLQNIWESLAYGFQNCCFKHLKHVYVRLWALKNLKPCSRQKIGWWQAYRLENSEGLGMLQHCAGYKTLRLHKAKGLYNQQANGMGWYRLTHEHWTSLLEILCSKFPCPRGDRLASWSLLENLEVIVADTRFEEHVLAASQSASSACAAILQDFAEFDLLRNYDGHK